MKKLLLIAIILFALILSALPVNADSAGRQAVVYYNEACDECATYINGELQEILQANQVEMVRKDYINQRENRKELNQKNDALGVPLELQSHLVTFIDEGQIVLQGEPPRQVVEDLLSTQDLPDRILIYSEEGEEDGYKAWAFAGPVQSYGVNEPVTTYLTWYQANQASFESSGIASSASRLLPAVLLTGLVDGINPCAMAILLFFITFLFTIRKARAAIARMGLVYIACVYIVYFLVGLGLLRATSLVQGHWLGQVGAGLLILFGLTNLLGAIFPKFPIRLELPEIGKEGLKNWMYRATLPATIVLGTLMGLESFPCSGGPYVAILGLLGSQTGFWEGFGYLALYNLMFIMPLVIILILALNPVMGAKIQAWERASSHKVRGITGGVMALIGLVLLIWVL
jgi:cytochrome c biogenesis protein CcdA